MTLVAPLVSAFFGDAKLTDISRVIAIQFLFFALGVIPDAQLQRALEFKWRSILELSAGVVNAAVTLGLALAGFGVWSLVYGSLVGAVWRTVGLNILHPFVQLPSFAFKGLGKLFSFGGYTVFARALGNLCMQADTIIGGRVLGQEQIGYYSVGMNLASLPMQRVSSIVNTVAFPAIARIQGERERVLSYLLKSFRLLNFFSFPVFWGIAAVAPEIVRVLLGAQWEPAILPLQILAFAMPIRMLWQFMPSILQGLGHARLVAQNTLLYVAMIAAFLVGVQFGIIGLSLTWVVAFPFVLMVAVRTWLPVFDMRASQFLDTMKSPAIAGAGMFMCVFAVRKLALAGGLAELGLLIAAGAISYAGLCWVMDRHIVRDIRSMLP
jgi:O-antigen/teichoic acid export membrane protein